MTDLRLSCRRCGSEEVEWTMVYADTVDAEFLHMDVRCRACGKRAKVTTLPGEEVDE